MAMDDVAWARHANPWSVWTRIPILPFLAFAIWARVWLSWWCLIPVGSLIAWALVNPRAFPVPKHTNHWASRGVMGERLFLARKIKPIPEHHRRAALLLTWASALGLLPLIYGLWVFNAWAVAFGLTLTVGSKMWFVDRMVWIYQDAQR